MGKSVGKYTLRKLLLILILAFLPTLGFAGTYYVSDDASGTWAGATSRSTPCSLATSNSNVAAGDTIILIADGGTFDDANAGLIGGIVRTLGG